MNPFEPPADPGGDASKMTEPIVRLHPPEKEGPEWSYLPTRHAHRWRSPFNDEAQPATTVFMTPRALVRSCAHAGTDLDREVGGGLVGMWRVDPSNQSMFTVVEAVIPARHARHGSAYLTFTQDTLVEMNDELEERFPGKRLVGWFHTHPRMGIFLSHYDQFLHRHFFPQPWQVALVIEPHESLGGFFIPQKEDGYLDPRRYFGFFELKEAEKASVMQWNNLTPDGELETAQDDPPVEEEVTEDE
jgi:proteasome lid subunit RPN8/RPN11